MRLLGLRRILMVVRRWWVLDGSFLDIVHGFFETSDRLAEGLAKLGKLAWTENQESNDKYDDKLWSAETSEHKAPPAEQNLRYARGHAKSTYQGINA